MSINKAIKSLIILGLSFSAFETLAYKYYASDVVRYGLSAHGITYKLRNKRGAVDAWKVNTSKANKTKARGSHIRVKRWGNTDCSGLAAPSLRYGGFKATTKKRKGSPSTRGLNNAARKGWSGLRFVKKSRGRILHGDILNRVGKPYGHVLLYNGFHRSGKLSTVEARCSKCGVGKFANRSWNSLGRYKIIRSKHVYADIKNNRKILKVVEGSGKNRRYKGKRTYKGPGSSTAVVVDNTPDTNNNVDTTRPSTDNTEKTFVKVKRGDSGWKIVTSQQMVTSF